MNGINVVTRDGTTAHPSDGELLRQFIHRRNDQAFAELVARHGRMVYGVCRRRLGHSQDAEDAVQIVFLTLARNAFKLVDSVTIAPWLHRIARQVGSKVLRTRARHRRASWTLTPDLAEKGESKADFDVDAALAELPGHERTAVILCHLEEMSRHEAAVVLGCPEGTLSARLSRALARLRRRFGRRSMAALATVSVEMPPRQLPAVTINAVRESRDRDLEDSALSNVMSLNRKAMSMGFQSYFITSMAVVVMALGIGFGSVAGWGLPAAESEPEVATPPRQNQTQRSLLDAVEGIINESEELTKRPPFSVNDEVGRILDEWQRRRATSTSIYAEFNRTVKGTVSGDIVQNAGSVRYRHSGLARMDIKRDVNGRGREVLLWTATNELRHYDVDKRNASVLEFDRSRLLDLASRSEFAWFARADKATIQKLGNMQKVHEDGTEVVLRVSARKREGATATSVTSMQVHLRKPDLLPKKIIVARELGEVTWEFTSLHENIEIPQSDFAEPKITLQDWTFKRHKSR